MTTRKIIAIYDSRCDYCQKWVYAGDWAEYNPYTKKVYHEDCVLAAEIGE